MHCIIAGSLDGHASTSLVVSKELTLEWKDYLDPRNSLKFLSTWTHQRGLRCVQSDIPKLDSSFSC